MKNTQQHSLKEWTAVAALAAAIAFSFTALFIPPMGIISASALWVVAQFLIFTASALGIDAYVSNRINNHPPE